MINNILYALILTLPTAAWLLYKFPFWEAVRDHTAIEANGSADTLKEWFHFWRGARRGVLQGGVVALAALPLLSRGLLAWGLLAGALGVASLTWFFITFNRELSLLRGLDPYYISSDPRAAFFPDRLLTKLGWGLKPVIAVLLWIGFAAAGALAVAAVTITIIKR